MESHTQFLFIMDCTSIIPLLSNPEGWSWEKPNGGGLLTGLPWCKNCPNGTVTPERIIRTQEHSKDFVGREDDVWVVGIPKSGTDWLQEIVWCIMNDMDLETAKNKSLMYRSPSHEINRKNPLPTGPPLESFLSPRVIKTHLQFPHLPNMLKGDTIAKIVYIARDPRDVCVSLFHHMKQYVGFNATMDDFVRYFVDDVVPYGSFWSHIQSFWEQRHQENVFFITYEEMMQDLPNAIKRIAQFLGKSLTEEEFFKLCEYASFQNRKSKVGCWKEELTQDQIQLLEKWMRKNNIPGLSDIAWGLETEAEYPGPSQNSMYLKYFLGISMNNWLA